MPGFSCPGSKLKLKGAKSEAELLSLVRLKESGRIQQEWKRKHGSQKASETGIALARFE